MIFKFYKSINLIFYSCGDHLIIFLIYFLTDRKYYLTYLPGSESWILNLILYYLQVY